MNKKIISLLTIITLLFAYVLPISVFAIPEADPYVEWSLSDDIDKEAAGTQVELTLKAYDVRFNVMQFTLGFDTSKVVLANKSTNAPTTTYNAVHTLIAPKFGENPDTFENEGWYNAVGGTVNNTAGSVEFAFNTHPDSRGVTNGSDSQGFVTADEIGLSIIKFHFKKLGDIDANTFKMLTSTDPGGNPANATGIIIVSDLGDLTAESYVTFDVGAVATPTPEPTATPTPTATPSPVPTGATLTVGDIKGKIGDTVKVSVSVASVPGIAGYQLDISYDKDKLEILSVEENDVLGGTFATNPVDVTTSVSGSFAASWMYTEPDTVGPDVDLFEISFKIKENVSGTADVSVSNLLIIDEATNAINVTEINGVVTIVTLSSITVDAVDPITVGGSTQLKVTANYSDETTEDVTSSASYISDDEDKATVSTTGLVEAVAEGGATITVTFGGKQDLVSVTVNPEPIIYGDINNDGEVTIADAVIALKASINLVELDEDVNQFIRADVNGDSKIDVKDAVLILRFIKNRITIFPVEQI